MRIALLSVIVWALIGTTTQAGLLLIEYTGTLSADSQLNSVNLGNHGHPFGTTFTIHSTFDPSLDLSATSGYGRFAAASTIDLNSYGTYTINSTSNFYVYFQNIAGFLVRTGLANSSSLDYWDVDLSVSPSTLPPDAPVAGTYSTSGSTVISPFTISMTSGDSLFVKSFVSSIGTTTITAVPVPEPSTYLQFTIIILSVVFLRWRAK